MADLPQESIDDLTDGLEADLMDAMSESRGDKPSEELTLNVVTAILLLPLAAVAGSTIDRAGATNLFVYDADGKPVPQAQIVDQDGRQLTISQGSALWDRATGEVTLWLDSRDAYDRPLGNVFPATSWTVTDYATYCTPQDREYWSVLKRAEYGLDGDSFYSPGHDKVLARVHGVNMDYFSMNGGGKFVLSGGAFTTNDRCVMGIEIPKDLQPQLFPVERLAPLKPAGDQEDGKTPAQDDKPGTSPSDSSAPEDDSKGAPEEDPAKAEQPETKDGAAATDTEDSGKGEPSAKEQGAEK